MSWPSGPRTAAAPLTVAMFSSKGRKQEQQDVPLLVADLLADGLVSLYGVLDGHGGIDCVDFVAGRLPVLLAEALADARESSAIKDALRAAFLRCDGELLTRAKERSWCDGCCCVALLVDRRCSPARAYCANLGDSRGYAAVAPGEPAAVARTVSLTNDHTAIDPKERKRIEAAGGTVEGGRVCGVLEVSRSFGDARLKTRGVSCTPDVTSFELKPAAAPGGQRFVLLGCDGFWKVFSTRTSARLYINHVTDTVHPCTRVLEGL